MRRLNLTRLVLLYNRKFEASEPTQALHYIPFLRDLKDRRGESMFSVCMSSLVITLREFDLLLGRLEPKGRRTKGPIDKFRVDASSVTEFVEAESERRGLHEDVVRLYDLAQNHDKV